MKKTFMKVFVLCLLFLVSGAVVYASPITLEVTINSKEALHDGERFVVTLDDTFVCNMEDDYKIDRTTNKQDKNRNYYVKTKIVTGIDDKQFHNINIEYVKDEKIISDYKFQANTDSKGILNLKYYFDGKNMVEQ